LARRAAARDRTCVFGLFPRRFADTAPEPP